MCLNYKPRVNQKESLKLIYSHIWKWTSKVKVKCNIKCDFCYSYCHPPPKNPDVSYMTGNEKSDLGHI